MVELLEMLERYFPLLLKGLENTIIIAIGGVALGVVLGIILCIMSISKNIVLRAIASFYIVVVRGIPLMILALFLYFGVIKSALPVLTSAIIILGINSSAFVSEVFRGGIQAIDVGQMEAARSLGLNGFQAMSRIILPQAFKIMIPSLMNQFIASLKDTSILSAISVSELTMQAKTIIARTYKPFEIYFFVLIMYVILITALTFVSKVVERKLSYDKR